MSFKCAGTNYEISIDGELYTPIEPLQLPKLIATPLPQSIFADFTTYRAHELAAAFQHLSRTADRFAVIWSNPTARGKKLAFLIRERRRERRFGVRRVLKNEIIERT